MLKSKYNYLKSVYTEETEAPDYKDKWYSWVLPLAGVILLVLLIIVANAYFHLLMISTSYITDSYPGTAKYFLIIGIPFYFFIMIVSAFAQANGYTNVVHKKFFIKKKSSTLFAYFINIVMIPFYIYNMFCVYVYVKHIL